MARDSVDSHVVEAAHHAAAQRAAGHPHVADARPGTGFGVEGLDGKGGGEAVEAAYSKQAVVHH